jgi:hypothetical protein
MSPFATVPIFYINLDKDVERRSCLEAQLAQYNATATRVAGVLAVPDLLSRCVLPENSGLTLPEIACTFAHLLTLQRYLNESDAPVALILEDDVDLSICERWNFTLREFLDRVPVSWDCIQLVNSQVNQTPQWHARGNNDWGTVAYLITRDFAAELVRAHLLDERLAPYARENKHPARAECVLFHTPRVFSVSLLSYHVSFPSNIHQHHVHEVHVPARQRVQWWWKKLRQVDALAAVFAAPAAIEMPSLLSIASLEYHVAHGCNLSCQQCSHYSNFRLGGLLSVEQARQEYELWADRLRPRVFALLGGEPTLNPELVSHVRLAREYWPDSQLMLVSNAFFLDRHPELPAVLVATDCCLEISKHGDSPEYVQQFNAGLETVYSWRKEYPKLRYNLRHSHQGWMRQYRVADGQPLPYQSEPAAAYHVCMQKTCTQLYQGQLWKCPALAYYSLFEKKLRLETVEAWDQFRQYAPCQPGASDEILHAFFATRDIPQCALCPSHREHFVHPNPLLKDSPLL